MGHHLEVARIGLVSVVVDDYDDAIAYYRDALGFELVEDTPLDQSTRWVVVAPPLNGGERGAAVLLAQAATEEQAARVGDQTGGRVFLFMETDDFRRDHARMTAAGVMFLEPPRDETYGTVAMFEDVYGNRWDLIEHRNGGASS